MGCLFSFFLFWRRLAHTKELKTSRAGTRLKIKQKQTAKVAPREIDIATMHAARARRLECAWLVTKICGNSLQVQKKNKSAWSATYWENNEERDVEGYEMRMPDGMHADTTAEGTEEETTGGRTTRVGRPRGGMRVAARIGEGLRREIERGRRPRVRVGEG